MTRLHSVGADAFSIQAAAHAAGAAPALVLDGETWTYERLATAACDHVSSPHAPAGDRPAHWPSQGRRDLAGLLDAYAAFEHRIPLVPVHPRWTDAESAQYRERLALGIEAIPAQLLAAEPAALLPTSGSTGRPKAVVLSRESLRAAVVASAARLGWAPAPESSGSGPADDRWLLALPLAHIGGLSIVLRCLAARATVVVAPEEPFRAKRLLDRIERERVTLLSVVPTMLSRLAEHPAPPGLRSVLVGGASAAPSVLARAAERGWPVRATYGLTEAASQVATEPADRSRLDGTCGPLLDGFEARLGPDGELELRGPALFSGYWPAGSSGLDRDGWFRTGDLARFEAGSLRILGRSDDVIVSGGENLFPAEIEAVLSEHPAVGAACVVGVDDPEWGQVAAAVVQPIASSSSELPLDLEGIAAFLAPRLARFKRPRRLLMVDRLPQTATGKVDRRAAAQLFQSAARDASRVDGGPV